MSQERYIKESLIKAVTEFNDDITDDVVVRFLEADKLLRSIDGVGGTEFNSEAIGCFFYIASHEGCNKQAMELNLGMSAASGSRNTDLLSKHHWRKKPNGEPRTGLDLIIKITDSANRRRQCLYLTPKGKWLIDKFKNIIYGKNLGI